MRTTTTTCDSCNREMSTSGAFFEAMVHGKHLLPLVVTIEVGGQGANDVCVDCGRKAVVDAVRTLALPL